jgi:hypothetical protein
MERIRYVDTILSKYQQHINLARKILLFKKDWFSMRDLAGNITINNGRITGDGYGRTKKD